MAHSHQSETLSRHVCFTMLEAAGCTWEEQIILFHSQLAELVGVDRSIRLAELVMEQYLGLLDHTTWN